MLYIFGFPNNARRSVGAASPTPGCKRGPEMGVASISRSFATHWSPVGVVTPHFVRKSGFCILRAITLRFSHQDPAAQAFRWRRAKLKDDSLFSKAWWAGSDSARIPSRPGPRPLLLRPSQPPHAARTSPPTLEMGPDSSSPPSPAALRPPHVPPPCEPGWNVPAGRYPPP